MAEISAESHDKISLLAPVQSSESTAVTEDSFTSTTSRASYMYMFLATCGFSASSLLLRFIEARPHMPVAHVVLVSAVVMRFVHGTCYGTRGKNDQKKKIMRRRWMRRKRKEFEVVAVSEHVRAGDVRAAVLSLAVGALVQSPSAPQGAAQLLQKICSIFPRSTINSNRISNLSNAVVDVEDAIGASDRVTCSVCTHGAAFISGFTYTKIASLGRLCTFLIQC